ncbi:MAG: hypothetical protein U9Q63_02710 [Patescibacteria group bacterium]|nr:hypothetical protein [Patescibacteria group bacterium]
MGRSKTRLQRKREKESLRQAVKYLFLIFLSLFLLIKFGLPGLINMATFIGNIRSSNQPIEKQDELAPRPPRLNPLPEATFSAQINVAGFAENGTSVKLYVRGININEIVANNEGEFEFKDVHLRQGENEIYTVAFDDHGNASDDSISYIIVVDNENPELLIDNPKDGDRFFDSDSPITISGSTEEGVSLKINNHFVMVKNDGTYSTSLSLSEGDNDIEVIAIDKAGNETRVAVKVNYTP